MTAPASGRTAIADLWGLLAELLSFPGPELEDEGRRGSVGAAVAHLAGHLGWDPGPAVAGLSQADARTLDTEFIRLFDAPDGAATPMYVGVYSRRRRDAMEELLRFYRHFGLTVSSSSHDLPDYVPTVLEFLRFLALRSAETADEAASRATADVIQRHLVPWAQQTAVRLQGRQPHPFYASVVGLVGGACAFELLGSAPVVLPLPR